MRFHLFIPITCRAQLLKCVCLSVWRVWDVSFFCRFVFRMQNYFNILTPHVNYQ